MLRLLFDLSLQLSCICFLLMDQEKPSIIYDKVGITSAVLCTIHCLAIPILFFIKSWYASSVTPLNLPYWWHSVDYAFLIVSFIAVYHSAGHSHFKEIKISLWVSWSILSVAILISDLHWLAYFASAGLVVTHFINIRRISRVIRTQ